MLDKIIKFAQRAGADQAVVKQQILHQDQIRFSKNNLSTTQSWQERNLDIFLVVKKKIVSTTLSCPNLKSAKQAVQSLVKQASLLKPKPDWAGIAKGPFKYKRIAKTYDKKIINADIADKVHAAINEANASSSGTLYRTLEQTELATSNNVQANYKSTAIELSIRAFQSKDESGHAVACARTLAQFDPVRAGAKAGLLAKLARRPHQGNPGKYTVLFDPLAFANFISLIGEFASAFYVESGFSFLANKLHKQIASEQFTLADAPDMRAGLGSVPFDDEGVPTSTTKIIDRGILNTYLHNTSTAKKYLTKTTANAGLISPRPFNLLLQPGHASKDHIVSELRDALYITNVWYTRFQNYLTGDFSTIPRDAILLIRNGDIVGSIKGIRISENMQRLIKSVVALSREHECIHWWEVGTPAYTPYVLVEDVNITCPIDKP